MSSYLAEALKHGRRPSSYSRDPKERKLAYSLASYTRKSHGFYDPIFDKRIRELRPDWFRKRKPGKNKKELLELAKSGAKKPSSTEKLGNVLGNYTCESACSYDPVFDEKIRELRPDWFINTADIKKKQLLKLARSGEKRPSNMAKDPEERRLGRALCNYTVMSQGIYDPVFDKKIRELRPDWFENTTIKKKEKLLKLAKSGGKKPSNMAKDPEERRLGNALINYISKNRRNARDPAFDRKIRKLRPDWFINTADLRKEELLKLAKSGAKRPSRTAKDPEERKLGQVLHSYLDKSHGSYDPVFDKKIRRLRPDWFRRRK